MRALRRLSFQGKPEYWRCLGCETENDGDVCQACGLRKGCEASAPEDVVLKRLSPDVPKRRTDARRRESFARLAVAVGTLLWKPKVEKTVAPEPPPPPKRDLKSVQIPSRPTVTKRRPSGKNKKRRESVSDKQVSVADRLARGRATVHRDQHNNTQKAVDALEQLLDDKTGASELGANYLRTLVMPELVFDDDDSEDDESPEDDKKEKKRKNKKGFDGEVDLDLLLATAKDPERRRVSELALINEHLGWHQYFNVARGRIKPRMLRHVGLVSPKAFRVVVLQNEPADAAYIIYSGRFAVHVHKTKEGEELLRRHRQHLKDGAAVAKNRQDYYDKAEGKIGPRVAILQQGHAFGENGLNGDESAKRNATVVALEPNGHLFCLQRSKLVAKKPPPGQPRSFEGAPHPDFVAVLRKDPSERTPTDLATIIWHTAWQPFLSVLEPQLAEVAARFLRLVEVPVDEVVVLQGDLADCYFIVYHGDAEVYVSPDVHRLNLWKGLNLWADGDHINDLVTVSLEDVGEKVFTLTPGIAFGESGLDPAGPKRRTATVVSIGNNGDSTFLLALYREDVRKKATPRPSLQDDDDDSVTAEDVPVKSEETRPGEATEFDDDELIRETVPTFHRRRCRIILSRVKKKEVGRRRSAVALRSETIDVVRLTAGKPERPKSAVS